jgi:colanic acid biosynthesis protein WcaH
MPKLPGGAQEMTGTLATEIFEHIVRGAPLCSIDIVIRDPQGAVMLGLRKNNPAKGFYFVPGGRIRKDETLAVAFQRILANETSIELGFSEAFFIGVFEHFYETNWKGLSGFGTHYVCLAYEVRLPARIDAILDTQHSEIVWASPSGFEKLKIHPYTLAYLHPQGSQRTKAAHAMTSG